MYFLLDKKVPKNQDLQIIC